MGFLRELLKELGVDAASDLFSNEGAEIDKIYQTVLRIEDNLNSLIEGYNEVKEFKTPDSLVMTLIKGLPGQMKEDYKDFKNAGIPEYKPHIVGDLVSEEWLKGNEAGKKEFEKNRAKYKDEDVEKIIKGLQFEENADEKYKEGFIDAIKVLKDQQEKGEGLLDERNPAGKKPKSEKGDAEGYIGDIKPEDQTMLEEIGGFIEAKITDAFDKQAAIKDLSTKIDNLLAHISLVDEAKAGELTDVEQKQPPQKEGKETDTKAILDELNRQKESITTQITTAKTSITETRNAVATVDERVKNIAALLDEHARKMFRQEYESSWTKPTDMADTRDRHNITIRGLKNYR